MARIIVLSGERGVGKSTVCHRTVAWAWADQYSCGGIMTLRRADGTRELLNVCNGERRRLTLDQKAEAAIIQGRFCFDPEALRWGSIEMARAMPCDLLVVDELGPLEIERKGGWYSAFSILHTGDFALAIVVIRPELIARAQLQLPPESTTVYPVTVQNRDVLPDILLKILRREVKGTSED